MNNIEAFDLACADLLARLYSAFPAPQKIDTLAVVRELIAAKRLDESAGLAVRRGLGAHTMDFLVAEGYVRISDSTGTVYAGAVLTAKGLAAMHRGLPDSLERPVTVGERLRELACVASAETAGVLVRAALSGLGT